MKGALAIARVELARFARDRGNVFFVFILPLMLVFVIGSQFGGSGGGSVTISGADSALRTELVRELEDAGLTVAHAQHDEMLEQVARGRTGAGIVIDPLDASRYDAGQPVEVAVIGGSGANGTAVVAQVRVAVSAVDLRRTCLLYTSDAADE